MKGRYITQEMAAGRILNHGLITALPFSLTNDVPFSIFINPATASTDTLLINCTLSHDDESSECPFLPNQWNEPLVKLIPAGAISLVNYDVYYGIGEALS